MTLLLLYFYYLIRIKFFKLLFDKSGSFVKLYYFFPPHPSFAYRKYAQL